MSKTKAEPAMDPAAEIAKLREQIQEQQQIIKEQVKELQIAERNRGDDARPIAKVDGAHYLVLGGVMHNGAAVNAEAIASDEVLCRKLIAMGSGLLVPAN